MKLFFAVVLLIVIGALGTLGWIVWTIVKDLNK